MSSRPVCRRATQAAEDEETVFRKLVAVFVVEFVAMAMAFVDDEGAVNLRRFGADDELAGLRAEAHRAAFFDDVLLRVEEGDDRVRVSGSNSVEWARSR